MKYKYLVFILFLFSCSHYEVLQYPDNFDNRVIAFHDYKIIIPPTQNWFVYSIDSLSQSAIIVDPDLKNIEASSLTKGEKKILLLTFNSSNHNFIKNYSEAYIEIIVSKIPPIISTKTNEEIKKIMVQEDFNYNVEHNIINANIKTNVGKLEFENGNSYYLMTLNTKTNFKELLVACSVFENNNNKYGIIGKLWSRNRLKHQDFFASLLENIEFN